MRYDVEIAVSDILTAYLKALASTKPGQILDPSACPIVTFYDPMSVDDADRVTVMVPNAETDAANPGNFSATVDIGLKTLWTQATLKNSFKRHFARVNDIRDKIMPKDIVERMTPYFVAGAVINYVQPRRDFDTHIAQANVNWIYSGTKFVVNGYFTTEA